MGAGKIPRPARVVVGLELDRDVLDWFKSAGSGYQGRIDAILRRYMEYRRKSS